MKKILFLIPVLLLSECNTTPVKITKDAELLRIDSIRQVENARVMDSVRAIEKKEHERWLLTKAGRISKIHPEWDKEACERISRGEIWIGMHIQMVRYMYGAPDKINVSDYGSGKQYQYCWHDLEPGFFYTDDDYIVNSYN
jgi:hypothetical protein